MEKKLIFTLFLVCFFQFVQARIIFSTIDTAGFYRLADDVTNQISINVSDVTLDLNGHRVSGGANGIAIAAGLDRITIKNGMVDGVADGISVGAAATNITLENIIAKNSVVGFNFTQVTGGVIKNCEMTQNTTGLELDNSHKIVVKDCIASCNTHAGYCLLSSTTNCFENCKALSTGEGNTNAFDNNVFGFVTNNGYGNIFERCIANSTQALTTTDYDSVVAGFAFRGNEGCSKIVECEAANSMSNFTGKTIPYGILLESSVGEFASVASATAGTLHNLAWSPDGIYLAVGSDTGSNDFQVYEFDRFANTLTSLVGTLGIIGSPTAVVWSPNGKLIAVGGNGFTGDELRIYEFDRANATLSLVASEFSGLNNVISLSWSSDGTFLAVGGSSLPTNNFQVFEYDARTNALDLVVGALGTTGSVFTCHWSPDDTLVAIGGNSLTADELQIFEFNRGNGTLTFLASALGGTVVIEVRWSPDGKLLVVGGLGLPSNELQVFEFDRGTNTLTSLAGALGTTGNIPGVDWSPNGRYIVIGGNGISGDIAQLFEFDRGANTLNFIASALGGGSDLQTVSWSPDGSFIATGGNAASSLNVLSILEFPEKNVIKNNTVYCNSGGECPSGVGISGSSIANLILGNSSYSNPIPRASNAPIVSSNYEFVINVFDGNSNGLANPFQNVKFDGCKPSLLTDNIVDEVRILKAKMCDIQSKVDAILLAV